MTKIEISKEETINGQWKWRVINADGSFWTDSEKGNLWAVSSEGERTLEDMRKALQVLSNAVAKG